MYQKFKWFAFFPSFKFDAIAGVKYSARKRASIKNKWISISESLSILITYRASIYAYFHFQNEWEENSLVLPKRRMDWHGILLRKMREKLVWLVWNSCQMNEWICNKSIREPEKSMTFAFASWMTVVRIGFAMELKFRWFLICIVSLERKRKIVRCTICIDALMHWCIDYTASDCVKSFESSLDRIMFSGFVSSNYGN